MGQSSNDFHPWLIPLKCLLCYSCALGGKPLSCHFLSHGALQKSLARVTHAGGEKPGGSYVSCILKLLLLYSLSFPR